MKVKLIVLTVGLATLAVIACSPKNVSEPEASITDVPTNISGNTAGSARLPDFTMLDMDGNLVSMQSLKGKKVLVNLWASWCPPCRREMPSIERLYKSIDTTKVTFVMLSLDDNFEKAKKYAMARKLMLPLFYPAEKLPQLFNVEGIPATFIFNEEGQLIKRVNGSDDYDAEKYRRIFQ